MCIYMRLCTHRPAEGGELPTNLKEGERKGFEESKENVGGEEIWDQGWEMWGEASDLQP